MKKLYISCPVEGRALLSVLHTVKKMHKIAEVLFDEELEVIDSVSVSELTGTDLHDLSRLRLIISFIFQIVKTERYI